MSILPAALVATMVIITASTVATTPPRGFSHDGVARPPQRAWSLRTPARRRRPSVREGISPGAVADWVDRIARSLRHGATLHAALASTEPVDATLREQSEPLRHWLGRGASVTDACDEWADRLAESHRARVDLVITVASVMAAISVVGGTAAAPLDRVAAAMRRHVSEDLERAAQSAQARMSARVLTIVPLAVLALLVGTDDAVRAVVASPTGSAVVLAGLAVNGGGALWMRRIAGAPPRRRPARAGGA